MAKRRLNPDNDPRWIESIEPMGGRTMWTFFQEINTRNWPWSEIRIVSVGFRDHPLYRVMIVPLLDPHDWGYILGPKESTFDFDAAKAAAEKWIRDYGGIDLKTGNPSDIIIDIAQAKLTLDSMLTEYDKRVSSRERIPNIYRLSHLFEASSRVFADLDRQVGAEVIQRRVERFFIVNDLPPAKKFLKLLSEQDATPQNGIYLMGYPKTKTRAKKK